MEIWLKGKTKNVRIPVLPSGYTVTSEQNNTSVDVVGLGEIVLTGKRKLRIISFSSFFPKRYDSSYCDVRPKNPKTYVDDIEKIKQDGKLKLIITGTSINFACIIDSFEWGEEDGTGDITYTLQFREYRAPSVVVSSVAKDATAAEQTTEKRDEKSASTGTYEVKKGDTLSGIARKILGTSSWKALYEQNKSVIGGNPNMIQIGMVLTLPGK